jgi:hypothetical protein
MMKFLRNSVNLGNCKVFGLRSYGVIILTIMLSACGPVYETTYEIIPPQSQHGAMCANNCLMSQTNCRNQCQRHDETCRRMAELEADNEYLHYLTLRQAQGLPVKRSRRDFYSYSSCGDYGCNESCANDYRICHTNCGGKIIPHTRCTAFCK